MFQCFVDLMSLVAMKIQENKRKTFLKKFSARPNMLFGEECFLGKNMKNMLFQKKKMK